MRSFPTLLLAGLAAASVACSGETSSVNVTARDASTQALTPMIPGAYSAILLDVVDILVRHDGYEDGWVDILPEPSTTIDLIALQNGELAALTTAPILPGTLTELRLVLRDGDQGSALNADGYFIPVRVPSGSQSGLKIKGTIVVPEGEEVEIPLAIDLDRALSETKDGVLRIQPVIWLASRDGDDEEPTDPVDPADPGDGQNPM